MIKLLDGQVLEQLAKSDLRSEARTVSGQSEALLRRAAQLEREDRLLVEMSLRCHLSQRRVATLVGRPHGTIARRLKRLTTRLKDPLVVRLLDGPCPLDRADRDIAIGYFLNRRSLRELSVAYRLPVPQVSRKIHFVRGWFRGITLRTIAEQRLVRGE